MLTTDDSSGNTRDQQNTTKMEIHVHEQVKMGEVLLRILSSCYLPLPAPHINFSSFYSILNLPGTNQMRIFYVRNVYSFGCCLKNNAIGQSFLRQMDPSKYPEEAWVT